MIERLERLPEDLVLLNEQELAIRKVIAVNRGSYWQSFVYVEAEPSIPSGLYSHHTPEFISNRFQQHGPVYEEYGLWQGRKVTRAEYDDGAAIIDGTPRRIAGAELRVRYVTAYNFVIASQGSPINDNQFDFPFEGIMNGILKGEQSVDDLIEAVLQLPKPHFRLAL
jgi:hypothetical protein